MTKQEITGELVHQNGSIYLKSGDFLLFCIFPYDLMDKASYCIRNHNEVTLQGVIRNRQIEVEFIGIQSTLIDF